MESLVDESTQQNQLRARVESNIEMVEGSNHIPYSNVSLLSSVRRHCSVSGRLNMYSAELTKQSQTVHSRCEQILFSVYKIVLLPN